MMGLFDLTFLTLCTFPAGVVLFLYARYIAKIDVQFLSALGYSFVVSEVGLLLSLYARLGRPNEYVVLALSALVLVFAIVLLVKIFHFGVKHIIGFTAFILVAQYIMLLAGVFLDSRLSYVHAYVPNAFCAEYGKHRTSWPDSLGCNDDGLVGRADGKFLRVNDLHPLTKQDIEYKKLVVVRDPFNGAKEVVKLEGLDDRESNILHVVDDIGNNSTTLKTIRWESVIGVDY